MASNKVALQVRFDEQTYTKLKKISADVRVYNVDSAETLAETIKAVKESC